MADVPSKDPEAKSPTALREEAVLSFWKEDHTFEKSLEKDAPHGDFVFYDGPPFATGLPHHGSLLSSIIKDVIPRYKTMRGYRVRRRWGWDTHGLPIESLVEKELGLKTKKDILDIGIGAFNAKARSMVLQFVSEWEKYVERVGRWVDFKNSYKTMDNSYIESVWWALAELRKKKLLYEGNRVLMYCPHCETPLAKAEIAMDDTYKDITEEAVTVKFKVKNPKQHNLPDNTFILAWTTTPWTLPGNVALAVGGDISYVVETHANEHLILAKDLSKNLGERISEVSGKDLVGLEYEPLFTVPALTSEKSYKVYAADFVSTEEGTGIVHTAVMYGEDDYALGQKVGLPMVQLLNPNGTYNNNAPESLRGVYIKTAEKQIKADLDSKGLLFEKKNNTHSYPHCYRCGTPLIYNAVPSWFINIQQVKDKLLSENENVNWVPEHLKHGRFKNIVENAPDWTISRNRFWATPLPIWKEKGGERVMVIGSLEELAQRAKHSGNRYFLMRHGQAESNVKNIVNGDPRVPNSLTIEGIEQIRRSVASSHLVPDVIYASPFPRGQETAKVVCDALALEQSRVITDKRLSEITFGDLEGRPARDYDTHFDEVGAYFSQKIDGAETWSDVRVRVFDFLSELERTHTGKTVLIITHDTPALLLDTVARGENETYAAKQKNNLPSHSFLKNAEIREMVYKALPRNERGELDIHRPYTDTITLLDEEGREYERIPEVVDCWVESGSMPFAELHYPFEHKELFKQRFPGDFIAEYIAQTRTWFYYMHAMGVLLFNGKAFKNVISTGTILASDGEKISKSKRNYTDPLELINRYGSDALRFYLMSSPIMQAEDLRFRDEDVRDAHNRVIQTLSNCLSFFELYKDEYDGTADGLKSPHALDQWILARLNELVISVTSAYEAYELPKATRPIRDFVDEYSTWYVRRSRERVKGDDASDKQYALATQKKVLDTLSRLMAPVTPFLSEHIYKALGGVESVHLVSWPTPLYTRGPFSFLGEKKRAKIMADMKEVRSIVSLGLEVRQRAGLKVRQPLATLSSGSEVALNQRFADIIAEEVNVKKVVFAKGQQEVVLDTTLTDALRVEGAVRELIRAVQDRRKEMKLSPADKVSVIIKTPEKNMAEQADSIQKAVNATEVRIQEGEEVLEVVVTKV